jgi:hypothetical protein
MQKKHKKLFWKFFDRWLINIMESEELIEVWETANAKIFVR